MSRLAQSLLQYEHSGNLKSQKNKYNY